MKGYTVEELLSRVAEGKKPRRRIENHSNVKRFIEEVGIKSGTKAYPTYVIYWYYRQKWPGDRSNKANKIVFFRTFSKQFSSYRHGKQRFYLLDESFLTLSTPILEEAEAYEQRYVQAKRKKNKESEDEQKT